MQVDEHEKVHRSTFYSNVRMKIWATKVNKLEPDKQNVKSPKKEVSLLEKRNARPLYSLLVVQSKIVSLMLKKMISSADLCNRQLFCVKPRKRYFPSDTYYVMYEGFFSDPYCQKRYNRNVRLGYFFVSEV